MLAGREPWQGISVRREDVRRQLEQELMGKLIHLRQVFAAEWGNPKRLQEVVRGSRAGFLTMLRAGGSDYPYELYKRAGIDLATAAPYQALIARMNRIMDEIEAVKR